jgi:large subunit ribosomal protein L28
MRGYAIERRGLAKKKGGVGRKITGRTKRNFRPNIQRIRAVVNGKIVRIRVCTSCIRAGKVTKPARAAKT